MPNTLKTYPAPWEGRLILACKKCQKKLKGDDDLRALAKLKKAVKRHNKSHPAEILHVINVPCMDLCPRKGITICDPLEPHRISVLRSDVDLELL